MSGSRTSESVSARPYSTVAVLLLGLGGLLCIAFIAAALVGTHTHPSDHELEADFRTHEADFEAIVAMSNVDSKVVRIAPTFTRLENNWHWPRPDSELGITHQRWDQYRQLFRKVGVREGIQRETSGKGTAIFFFVSMTGMVTGGDEKGYAYVSWEPTPTVESLDHPVIEVKSNEPVYKKLKGNWYLYYSWDD